jgi:hypothetical protein
LAKSSAKEDLPPGVTDISYMALGPNPSPALSDILPTMNQLYEMTQSGLMRTVLYDWNEHMLDQYVALLRREQQSAAPSATHGPATSSATVSAEDNG